MEAKLLLIVDPQIDFISGSLVVPGAVKAMDGLSKYVEENSKNYDLIFITADWHPITHCSFKENGGEWPMHCVQHTIGAAIYQGIIDALNKTKSDYMVLTKGDNENREEYSIFNNVARGDVLKSFAKDSNIAEIDICGLAGDICVLNTLKDALQVFHGAKFNVLEKFTPSIDGGKALQDFVDSSERVNLS